MTQTYKLLEDAGSDDSFDLVEERRKNDVRLKGRFDSIFERYARDFSEIDDEFDLVTGERVVNNGFLEKFNTGKMIGKACVTTGLPTPKKITDQEDSDDELDHRASKRRRLESPQDTSVNININIGNLTNNIFAPNIFAQFLGDRDVTSYSPLEKMAEQFASSTMQSMGLSAGQSSSNTSAMQQKIAHEFSSAMQRMLPSIGQHINTPDQQVGVENRISECEKDESSVDIQNPQPSPRTDPEKLGREDSHAGQLTSNSSQVWDVSVVIPLKKSMESTKITEQSKPQQTQAVEEQNMCNVDGQEQRTSLPKPEATNSAEIDASLADSIEVEPTPTPRSDGFSDEVVFRSPKSLFRADIERIRDLRLAKKWRFRRIHDLFPNVSVSKLRCFCKPTISINSSPSSPLPTPPPPPKTPEREPSMAIDDATFRKNWKVRKSRLSDTEVTPPRPMVSTNDLPFTDKEYDESSDYPAHDRPDTHEMQDSVAASQKLDLIEDLIVCELPDSYADTIDHTFDPGLMDETGGLAKFLIDDAARDCLPSHISNPLSDFPMVQEDDTFNTIETDVAGEYLGPMFTESTMTKDCPLSEKPVQGVMLQEVPNSEELALEGSSSGSPLSQQTSKSMQEETAQGERTCKEPELEASVLESILSDGTALNYFNLNDPILEETVLGCVIQETPPLEGSMPESNTLDEPLLEDSLVEELMSYETAVEQTVIEETPTQEATAVAENPVAKATILDEKALIEHALDDPIPVDTLELLSVNPQSSNDISSPPSDISLDTSTPVQSTEPVLLDSDLYCLVDESEDELDTPRASTRFLQSISRSQMANKQLDISSDVGLESEDELA